MDEHGTGEPTQPYGAPQTYGGTPEVLDSAAPGASVLPGYDPAGPNGQAGQRPRPPHRDRRRGRRRCAAGVRRGVRGMVAAEPDGPEVRRRSCRPAPSRWPRSTSTRRRPRRSRCSTSCASCRAPPGLQGSDGTFQDWVGRTLSEGADSGTGSSDGLDFAHDVQPWLGSRVAVAAVPSGQKSSPVDAVLVVQEKDDAAAAAAMDKLRAHGSPDLGYVVKDGYLVVTPDSRTGATRVVTAAEKGSLAGRRALRRRHRLAGLRGGADRLGGRRSPERPAPPADAGPRSAATPARWAGSTRSAG